MADTKSAEAVELLTRATELLNGAGPIVAVVAGSVLLLIESLRGRGIDPGPFAGQVTRIKAVIGDILDADAAYRTRHPQS